MESLRQHFTGAAAKYLSAVHATPRSNQHEIGSNAFVQILGNSGERRIRTKYLFTLEPAISIHQTSLRQVASAIIAGGESRPLFN
jgi:hypothetical protein